MAQKKFKAKVNSAFRIQGGEAKVGSVVEINGNDYHYLKGLGIVSEVVEEKVVEEKKESKKKSKE